MSVALHPAADPLASLPAATGARLDHAERAVQALEGEQRRLGLLGLETPLARIHQQLRYWRFVRSLLRVSATEIR